MKSLNRGASNCQVRQGEVKTKACEIQNQNILIPGSPFYNIHAILLLQEILKFSLEPETSTHSFLMGSCWLANFLALPREKHQNNKHSHQ